MSLFEPGNEMWKQRRPRQPKGNGIRVLRPLEEVDYWRDMLKMAKEQKDYKAIMAALEIINVIQRGKPATQEPTKSREKKDDLGDLMRNVFQSKPSKSKPVTQSNQSDIEE